ncbi:MAG: M48 family metalloprotease [Planctomycetes bacterium]|nr:M48 family metalloprotease [Planctomycetota bacterium]
MQLRSLVGCLVLFALAGCTPHRLLAPERPPTLQVAGSLTDPGKAPPKSVSYPPASRDVSYRVLLIKDKLIGENPQVGLKPYVNAIGSTDPEVFHIGLNQIFITEGLIKQCQTDGQLAAVIANELGKMVSEREATVPDDIRQPDRLPPVHLPIGGGGNATEADPVHRIEMARYEKQHPKQFAKLPRPNPQTVARSILEKACYQTTDLDAAWPLLQNAQRFSRFENQFKGTTPQGNWKAP